jgi:hypothetical protein
MSVTAPAAGRNLPGAGSGSRLPTPPRDRRPAMAALALLLIVTGALASALVTYRSGNRVDVLVASREIPPGTVLTRQDLTTARVAADAGATISASAMEKFLGSTAVTGIPRNTLLNRSMFLAGDVMPLNSVVVGVVVGTQQRPAESINSGDVVRVYVSAADDNGNSVGQPGDVLVKAARVVSVKDGSSSSMSVSLLLPDQVAKMVIPVAADGRIAVAALAPGTTPVIDYRTGQA